ncbi:phage tail protein, partial [Xenorhabdus anantnagensis]
TVNQAKNAVPNSRKVNEKSLTDDINLNAVDVGAFSRGATTFVQGENGVPWNAASGSYVAQRTGDSLLIVHFNVDTGSTPALQLKTIYRNNGIAYRSARDDFGFEEPWTEFYTTKNKPTAFDVDAVSSSHGGTFHEHVRFDKNVIVGNNDNSDMKLISNGSAVSPVHIQTWGNAAQGGNRYTVLEADDNQGWLWYSQRIDNGEVHFAVNGKMLPNNYGNFDSRYLQHHQQNIPVGVPLPWSHANPPDGYFECNGQQFDKSQYPKLAMAYPSGTVPDLRGEFIRGLDNGRGADPNRGILTHQEGTIISGLDDNDTGDISSVGSPAVVFGDPMTDAQWANIKGKKWISLNRDGIENRYDWWAYVSARPRNIAFLYIVRAA